MTGGRPPAENGLLSGKSWAGVGSCGASGGGGDVPNESPKMDGAVTPTGGEKRLGPNSRPGERTGRCM